MCIWFVITADRITQHACEVHTAATETAATAAPASTAILCRLLWLTSQENKN